MAQEKTKEQLLKEINRLRVKIATYEHVSVEKIVTEHPGFINLFFDNISDGVVLFDAQLNYVYVNNKAGELLGKTPGELIGKNYWKLYPEAKGTSFANAYVKALKTKTEIIFENYYEPWNRWFENRIYPYQDGIFVFFRETTQSKQAEETLKAVNSKLKENNRKLTTNKKRYKTLISVSNTGAWEYHFDTDFLWCSPEYFSMLGRDVNDFDLSGVGNLKETWIDLLHPDDREKASTHFADYLQNGSVGMYENYFRMQHSNGSWVWILSRGTTIRDKNGKITNLTVGTHINITRQKQEEEKLKAANQQLQASDQQLRAANQQLEANNRQLMESEENLKTALEKAKESDRLKSAFLANMSHEIRTPMNAILGFSDLLTDEDFSQLEKKTFIENIQKGGKRMLNTINEIIDISKIEAGQVKVSKKPVSVNRLLSDLFIFFKPVAEAKGLQLNMLTSLSNDEATIITDLNKLNVILTNLINNAIKFTDRGAIRFGYHLKKEKNEKRFELEFFVNDTGIGIPKERKQAIFNRFEQGDIEDKRAFQGSGLGLSITKAYVELLGGKLWLVSEEENLPSGKTGGSTFMFTIPYQPKYSPNLQHERVSKSKTVRTEAMNLTMLIVEDEPSNASLLELMLGKMLKHIYHAETGKEAVEICKRHPEIDVVLMDIKLPIMDGYEATREIREFNKAVIIIAQTALAFIGDKEKAIDAGCNDYISKPIDKNKLLKMINRHIKPRKGL